MARSRSRSRSRSHGAGRGRREPDIAADVEAFLRAEPDLEERAVTMLRTKPPEVQKLVVARGGLQGTRNPTAVLVSRIRNAEEGLRPVLETERAGEDIERFLVVERVEAHAAARLRRSAKEVQVAVVARGTLSGTRDPTAVLMTRIRDAERDVVPSPEEQLAQVQRAAASAAAENAASSMQWYGADPQAYALAYYAQMQQMYPQAVQAATQEVPSLQTSYGADGQAQLTGPDGQHMQVTAVYPNASLGAFGSQAGLGYAGLAALYGLQPDAGFGAALPIADQAAPAGGQAADLAALSAFQPQAFPAGGWGYPTQPAGALPGGLAGYGSMPAAGGLGY